MLNLHYEKMIQIYKNHETYSIFEGSPIHDLLNRVFLFYQHFNGDELKLDEIEETQIKTTLVQAVLRSEQDDDTYEIISVFDSENFDVEEENIKLHINNMDILIAQALSGYKTNEAGLLVEKFISLEAKGDKNFRATILVDKVPNNKTKSELRELVTNFKGIVPNLNYIIYFADDINEIILDIESPTQYVKNGELILTDSSILSHGDEKSIIVSISAKSLKKMYEKYGTNGLFASNLRFYIKSAKIDTSIKNTIMNEPENFWYFNNGLIITCEDYKILGNALYLSNFSVVNGGQTTNLIGNTIFERDFSVTCKVIKNKYNDNDSNLEFLSKVAEASNTQKPIKVKDLIANRVEQRRLKQQFDSIGVYLQIKRGEKINKTIYPEKWQNANNEEIGQTLFSFVYQRPGNAKNAKSAMLQNENNYKLIFQNQYHNLFFLSIQYIKVAFSDWKVKVKKNETEPNKIAIVNNSYFLFMAVIGFLAKLYLNKELFEYVCNSIDSFDLNDNDDLKMYLSQNDIGLTPIFKNHEFFTNKIYATNLFEFLYKYVFSPSFVKFKNKYYNFGAGHFSKSDAHYYNFIVSQIVQDIQAGNWNSGINYKNMLSKYLVDPDELNIQLVKEDEIFNEHKPGLAQELHQFKLRVFKEKNGTVKTWQILTNNQIAKIDFHKPRTLDRLRIDAGLRNEQIKLYGEDILSIVEKYVFI